MNRGRSVLFALILSLAALSLMAWAGWSAMRRSAGMTPINMSGTAFADAAQGASAELVVEVLSTGADGQLKARLLEKQGSTYRRTSTFLAAQLLADSAVVMGAAADIKPRAVLQLSGRFDDRHRVRVAQVVVLTGYVTVER